jgi:hypothetical protein
MTAVPWTWAMRETISSSDHSDFAAGVDTYWLAV